MYLENEANQCSLCIVLSIHALLLRCWLFGLEGMQVIQLSSQVDHVLSLINGLCFLFKSGHPPHVHLSWPLSVLCTKLRLCTKDCLKEAFSQFMQRLQMCHCPDLMTDQLTEAFHEFNLKSPITSEFKRLEPNQFCGWFYLGTQALLILGLLVGLLGCQRNLC